MDSTKCYELTHPQKRIWFSEVLNNHLDMSNIGYLIELKGVYDLRKLATAIKYVVKANDSLRLRFKYPDENKGEPVLYVPEYEEIDVEIVETDTEEELFTIIEERHRARFDLDAPFHCGFVVYSIGGKRFGLFEKAHHLVADGLSATIVSREAIAIYRQLEDGTFEDVEKKTSYLEFVQGEQNYIDSDKYRKDKTYWLQRFGDFEGEEITFVSNKDKKNSLKVKRRSFSVPGHMIDRLEEYKTQNRLSNFHLFMAAMGIYFNRFFNHRDIVIGMPVHNRAGKLFRNMVGMFVSTLPYRIKFEEGWSFDDLIANLKKELWNSLKHQGYPYNHLVKDLKELDIDSSNFLNVQLIELPGTGHDEITSRAFYSTQYNISQLSIYLNQENSPKLGDLEIVVDYHEDVFRERDIDALLNRLMIILEQAAGEPGKDLAQLPLLEDAEYNELVSDLNDTAAPFPADKTLPELFAEQVSKNPGNIALEYEGREITYKEFDELTGKLAVKLQKAGIGPDSIVGMLCERSVEAMVSIMGTLKAGGAYLPIDPDYPLDRKDYIIRNSGIQVLLVEKLLEEREKELLETNPNIKIIIVDYPILEMESPEGELQAPGLTSENLAYVIYTSGTTGNPKGTLLRHRNVVNYVWWGAKVYTEGETVTFPLFTSLSFDLTVTSIFIPLVTGNRIVIYRDSKDGLLVERVVKENKVNIVKLTPSHLKIVNQLTCDKSSIRSFILGGEELKTDTARETHDSFNGKINIYNEYGPTETAVGCMIHRYDTATDTHLAVPIGKPADNVQIYILDKDKKPLPPGIVGEIYIAGEGVARGYHNNDQLTAGKFVDNPFAPGKKMYRSGDLGRWNLDRTLEFFGRSDEQVKIRGYRIELGEIEKHLSAVEGIKDAVVALIKGSQPELRAYFVPEGDREFQISQLRELLSKELPAYMLPSEFVEVDNIPLTRNGKVDFRKLETMGKKLASDRVYMAPRDETETLLAQIWADVLGTERIGITDNFFEMGGDSIKAVQIAARMNDAGKSVNVNEILSNETIANICANVDFDSHIRKYQQGTVSGEKGITPIEGWFLAQGFYNPNHYHQSVLLEMKKPVDVPLLEKAFKKLITHHDGLRLNYLKEKNLFYFNNSHLDQLFKIEIVDNDAQIETKGYEAKGRFDIETDPMLRAVLFKGQPDKLLIILHHLVSDGITWRILLEDLYKIYNALQNKQAVELPQKTGSLLDWYDAMVMYRDSGKLEKEQEYWLEADASGFRLPYDRDPGHVDWSVKNRAILDVRLEQEETSFLLKDAHETYKTDAQILILAALVRTLRKWAGHHDVTVEMENHGRHIEDIDTNRTTGWFTAIYPLRVKKQDDTIGDEIKTVKETLRKAPNNGIGYGVLKYMSEAGKNMPTQRAEIRFNYLGQFDSEVENDLFSHCQQSTGSDVARENHMTAAIEINAMILHDVLTAEINYNNEALDESTMKTFGENYISNLREILDHIKGEDDVHFTSSDFDTVDLDDDDLDALFG